MTDPKDKETERLPATQPPPPALLIDTEDLARGLQARAKMVHEIKQFMGNLLQDGTHYATLPGTEKPTLLQPGAEDLALAARATFEVVNTTERELPRDHLDITTRVRLVARDGHLLAEGIGSASTMESKYRWRFANPKCPICEQETIIKGKDQYGGGWLCWKKKGGCGAKFDDGDQTIEGQKTGQVENENIADMYNTARKISHKRAIIAAAKTGFGVSSLFTQDVEDLPPGFGGTPAPRGNGGGPPPPPTTDSNPDAAAPNQSRRRSPAGAARASSPSSGRTSSSPSSHPPNNIFKYSTPARKTTIDDPFPAPRDAEAVIAGLRKELAAEFQLYMNALMVAPDEQKSVVEQIVLAVTGKKKASTEDELRRVLEHVREERGKYEGKPEVKSQEIPF